MNRGYTPVTDKTQMRDAAINRIYDIASQDSRVMFIKADMGAPAMDRFKRDLSGQFRDVGIAEQAAASIAAGMAHSGKIPFIYAIAPFLVSRIAEHHKVNAGIQSIPAFTL